MKYWCFDLFLTLMDVRRGLPREKDLIGVSREEWARCYELPAFYERRNRGLVTEPIEICRELIAAFGKRLDEAGVREFLRKREDALRLDLMEIRPEILETLRALKSRGCELCLVSNADAIDVLHWADSPLAPLFDHAIFSYQVGMIKPEPGIYWLAMKRLGVPPADCVFVGDGGSNELAGAKAVGMRTIQVRHIVKRSPIEDADIILDDFRDILSYTGEHA